MKFNSVLRTFLCSSDLYFLGFNHRSNLYRKKQWEFNGAIIIVVMITPILLQRQLFLKDYLI